MIGFCSRGSLIWEVIESVGEFGEILNGCVNLGVLIISFERYRTGIQFGDKKKMGFELVRVGGGCVIQIGF